MNGLFSPSFGSRLKKQKLFDQAFLYSLVKQELEKFLELLDFNQTKKKSDFDNTQPENLDYNFFLKLNDSTIFLQICSKNIYLLNEVRIFQNSFINQLMEKLDLMPLKIKEIQLKFKKI